MPSSRDALKLAAYGVCSRCGDIKMLYGKRLRLCHDCAAQGDYWTESRPEADHLESAIDGLLNDGAIDLGMLSLFVAVLRAKTITAQQFAAQKEKP